jgi:hypothetical protein
MKRNPILVADKSFRTQTECEEYTRQLLSEIGVTDSVKQTNVNHFEYLLSLCKRHPNSEKKLCQFEDFQLRRPALNRKGMELSILNVDGSMTEISWIKCVSGKPSTNKSKFHSALRQSVCDQIKEFRNKCEKSQCPECECSLLDTRYHIDHYEPQFAELVDNFLALNKSIRIPDIYNKKPLTFELYFLDSDKWIGNLFEEYHLNNATLRVICEQCNLRRKKYKKSEK